MPPLEMERMHMSTAIKPPERVLNIMRAFRENGYDAYAVGGCIRDSVLGREPKDWDITTNALPSVIKTLFEKTVDTGLKHGTVTVVFEGEAFEVTTFRIDGAYEDGRHPSYVEFTGKLEDDLRRRDFTMNAMAWNEEKGIVDPFGGSEDISAGMIRAIGEPADRFREDALRMLRAVRFAAQLGFEIHQRTMEAIRKNCKLINNVSSERIREELNGIMTAEDPMKLVLLREAGMMQLILPELEVCFATPQNNPHHVYNVGEHTLRSVAAIENDKCLRWAMLLHDTGKAVTRTTDEKGIDHYYGHPVKSMEIAEAVMKRLKFDKKSMERIIRLIRFHDRDILPQPKAVAKAVNVVGDDIFIDLLKVKRADKAAQNPSDLQKGIEYIDTIERIYIGLKADHYCLSLRDLAIDGRDLVALGFQEGKEIGKMLKFLFEKVLEDPAFNEKEKLKELAAKVYCDKISSNLTKNNIEGR